MQRKLKRGRPTKPSAQRRVVRVVAMLTPGEAEALHRVAKLRRMSSISETIRSLILKADRC